MRLSMLQVVVLCCASLLIVSVANSKPVAGPRGQHADRNKDGVVDRKEMKMEKRWEQQQRSQVNTRAEVRADTNKDGVVDSTEATAMKEKMKEKLDLNNDGVVDKQEKMTSWQHSRAKVNTALEQQYDANNDGWLEPAEARELVRNRYELIKSHGKAKVDTDLEKQYDANNDGILDASEARVMLDASKE